MTIGLVGCNHSALVLEFSLAHIRYFDNRDIITAVIESSGLCRRYHCGWPWQQPFLDCTADNGVLPDNYYPSFSQLDRVAREVRGKFLSLKTEDFVIAVD